MLLFLTFVKGKPILSSELCTHKQTTFTMKVIRTTFLVSAALFSTSVFAQTAPTLKELVDSAMVQDANLTDQVLQNKLTQLDDEKLKDVFLPKLDVSGKVGYMYGAGHFKTPEMTLIPPIAGVFPGLSLPETSNTLNVSGFSAALNAEASMVLYSGGKVKYLQEANREKSLSEQKLMDKSKDEVITEVSKAYDQFALIAETKNVLDEAKKRLDINRKTADKALGYGLITPYDHRKIELAQATLDSKLVEYEGKKQLLITHLHLLTGIERERIQVIQPELKRVDYLTKESNVQNRAEIQALDHGIRASEFKIKAEERWWVPKVQALTSLTYFGLYDNHISTSKALIPGTNTKLNWDPSALHIAPLFQAGVGFKWDILDGNEGKTAVETAKIQKEMLENKKRDAEKKLKLNLENNTINLSIAEAQIELKSKARSIAKNALQNVEKEFRYGTKKSSDLIDAENDLETAELEYQTAIFNQRRNAIELMKSTQNLQLEKLY